LEFDQHALEDMIWWVQTNRKTALKIMNLILEIQKSPFRGNGKPEPLKHELNGCWSRRIDKEHRIVYQVLDEKIRILACRHHYKRKQ